MIIRLTHFFRNTLQNIGFLRIFVITYDFRFYVYFYFLESEPNLMQTNSNWYKNQHLDVKIWIGWKNLKNQTLSRRKVWHCYNSYVQWIFSRKFDMPPYRGRSITCPAIFYGHPKHIGQFLIHMKVSRMIEKHKEAVITFSNWMKSHSFSFFFIIPI